MIQRIQSILLFLIALAMFVTAAILPIWSAKAGEKGVYLTAKSMILQEGATVTNLDSPILILILAVIAGIVALFSIFQYKNRLLQMKLGALNSLFIGATLIAMVYYVNIGESALNQQELQGGYLIGFWMPIIAALFNFLANRFIRKDEKLVRDADRLR